VRISIIPSRDDVLTRSCTMPYLDATRDGR
jgi:hypothetical protein